MRIGFEEAADFLNGCTDVLIITHASPDGDTLGCGFGLCRALRQCGKKADVVCADPIPPRYDFLKEWYAPQGFEPKQIIAVDIADTKLMGRLSDYGDKVDLCIDHHITNTGYAKRLLLGEKSAAACEVVYTLLKTAGMPIDETAAMCLYTGIATDTGCFKFESVTPETHMIAAELYRYEFPLPAAKLNRWLFDIKSQSRVKAEGIIIKNTELLCDGKCAMTSVTLDEERESGISADDFDGIASLPMQFEGVEIAVTVREKDPGRFKISIRTGTDANASRICSSFGGGGHIRAAGCTITGRLDDVKAQLLKACAEELHNVGY
ncbi:MAG: bifunctional oligoribonuclease/PAP phosphatase NrnA [Oscillospiraceae bacterium]|nr:bifunctional oligoribonuclease/PAP phosphatase NrnA [Oscillospiraceae bacterium]MDY2846768.1 bifunctional oligoribonuclease/PAP phosphatase NrnA [Oscillospiraceae bacterium]